MFININLYDYSNCRCINTLYNTEHIVKIRVIDELIRLKEDEIIKEHPNCISKSPPEARSVLYFHDGGSCDVLESIEEIQQLIKKERMSIYN
jgi:hypothetical protein